MNVEPRAQLLPHPPRRFARCIRLCHLSFVYLESVASESRSRGFYGSGDMIRGSSWEAESRLANLSRIERRADGGSADQWSVLEDRVCSLGLGTLRRLSSPSLRGYSGE